MTKKEIKTRKVQRENFHNFMKKGKEFYKSAENNFFSERWNAAGLDAIHSGISANDAILVYFHGKEV